MRDRITSAWLLRGPTFQRADLSPSHLLRLQRCLPGLRCGTRNDWRNLHPAGFMRRLSEHEADAQGYFCAVGAIFQGARELPAVVDSGPRRRSSLPLLRNAVYLRHVEGVVCGGGEEVVVRRRFSSVGVACRLEYTAFTSAYQLTLRSAKRIASLSNCSRRGARRMRHRRRGIRGAFTTGVKSAWSIMSQMKPPW